MDVRYNELVNDVDGWRVDRRQYAFSEAGSLCAVSCVVIAYSLSI
jgi:hypothetical protein